MTLINGIGIDILFFPDIYRYNGNDKELADTLHTAIETARIALAPRFPLFFVPSSSIKVYLIHFDLEDLNQLVIQKFEYLYFQQL